MGVPLASLRRLWQTLDFLLPLLSQFLLQGAPGGGPAGVQPERTVVLPRPPRGEPHGEEGQAACPENGLRQM